MEFPHLQKLADEFKGSKLSILTVNLKDTPEKVKAYFEENGFTFTVLPNGTGENDAIARYQVRHYPTHYVIGKRRKILKVVIEADPVKGTQALRQALLDAGLKPTAAR